MKRFIAPVSEHDRFYRILVRKYYVIPLFIAKYRNDPAGGYGLTKERAIASLLKKRARK